MPFDLPSFSFFLFLNLPHPLSGQLPGLFPDSLFPLLFFSYVFQQLSGDLPGLFIDAEPFAWLRVYPLIKPRFSHQDFPTRRVADVFQLSSLNRLSQEPFRAFRERHQVGFILATFYRKVGIRELPIIQDVVKSIVLILSLQQSVAGCRMGIGSSERISCEPEIQSVQFEPPWLFCAFLGFHLERVHHRVTGASQGGERNGDTVLLFGKRAQRTRSIQWTLTTTTAIGGCNG